VLAVPVVPEVLLGLILEEKENLQLTTFLHSLRLVVGQEAQTVLSSHRVSLGLEPPAESVGKICLVRLV
jgi:hypothetical protein